MSYENVLNFLTRLDEDRLLAAQCRAADLNGRIAIAQELGCTFTENELLRAVDLWNYGGNWSQWIPKDYYAGRSNDLSQLSELYPLEEEKVEAFQRDGHTMLRGVVSAEEMVMVRPIIRDALERIHIDTRPFAERKKEGTTMFIRALNMWLQDDNARRIVLARRFGRLAAQLMGVENVRIYFDQALFKESGGNPTPWHQDQLYFPIDQPKVISMWLPLVDIPAGMTFASGSQETGYIGDLPIGDAGADEALSNLIADRNYKKVSVGSLKAGDATFHGGWTLHTAPQNKEPIMREVMVVVYYADGAKLTTPENKYQQRALDHLFIGQKAGDQAAGPYHPIVS